MLPGSRAREVVFVVCAVLASGCGGAAKTGDDAGTNTPGASMRIGAEGGTLQGPGGSQVVVPPGALDHAVDLVIAQSSDGAPAFPPAGVTAAGPLYAITPHGTSFSKPVTVTIPFDASLVPSGRVPSLYQAEPGGAFALIPSTVQGATLVAQVSTFSHFGPGVPAKLQAGALFGRCVREALTAQIWCWGIQGQLADESGLGATSNSNVFPEPTRLPPREFGEVAGGLELTCGISNGSEVWCIGNRNAINFAGVNPPVPHSAWVQIPMPTGVQLYRLSVNANMACGIASPTSQDRAQVGKVFCFGENFLNMLGRGAASGVGVAPIASTATYAYVAVGGSFVCASRDLANGQVNGAVDCWGDNGRGQLSSSASLASSNVPIARGVVAVTAPGGLVANIDDACALQSDHSVICWGDNTSGQKGDGTIASGAPGSNHVPPSKVMGHLFDAVVTGPTSCGLDTTGVAYCWGANDQGELGSGAASFTPQPVPTQVAGPIALVELSADQCGRTAEGSVFCWGGNRSFELGLGQDTPAFSATPVEVKDIGLSKVMP